MILEIDIKLATDRDFIDVLHFCAAHDVTAIVGPENDKFAQSIATDLNVAYITDAEKATHTYRKTPNDRKTTR